MERRFCLIYRDANWGRINAIRNTSVINTEIRNLQKPGWAESFDKRQKSPQEESDGMNTKPIWRYTKCDKIAETCTSISRKKMARAQITVPQNHTNGEKG